MEFNLGFKGLIQCCETNCWHLEPTKYLETGLFLVAGISDLVFELSNSATSRLTIKNGVVMVMTYVILLYNCIELQECSWV